MKLIKFEKNNCRDCGAVENFLQSQNVEYEKVNIESPDVDLDFVAEYVDFAIPVTILLDENGELIKKSIRFNPEELTEIVDIFKGDIA